MGRAGWSWAAAVIGALRSQPVGRPWRNDGLDVWARLKEWEDQAPPGDVGSKPIDPAAAAAAAGHPAGPLRTGRAAPDPVDLCLGSRSRLPAARARGRADDDAGGGGHRRRQDAGLSRAGLAVGGGQRARGLDQHLHPRAAAPDRAGEPRRLPRSGGARGEGGRAQGAGELPLPAQLPGRSERLAAGRRRLRRTGARRALDRGRARRRHDRRRLPGLAADAVQRLAPGPGQRRQPRRPAGRMHPRRLPALSGVFHRKGGARLSARRPGDRQPCPGPDPGGARRRAGGAGPGGGQRDLPSAPHRVRRGPPPVRRRRQRLRGGAVRSRIGGDAPLDPGTRRARSAGAGARGAADGGARRPRGLPGSPARRRPRGRGAAGRGLVGADRPGDRGRQPVGPDRDLPGRGPGTAPRPRDAVRRGDGMRRAARA